MSRPIAHWIVFLFESRLYFNDKNDALPLCSGSQRMGILSCTHASYYGRGCAKVIQKLIINCSMHFFLNIHKKAMTKIMSWIDRVCNMRMRNIKSKWRCTCSFVFLWYTKTIKRILSNFYQGAAFSYQSRKYTMSMMFLYLGKAIPWVWIPNVLLLFKEEYFRNCWFPTFSCTIDAIWKKTSYSKYFIPIPNYIPHYAHCK